MSTPLAGACSAPFTMTARPPPMRNVKGSSPPGEVRTARHVPSIEGCLQAVSKRHAMTSDLTARIVTRSEWGAGALAGEKEYRNAAEGGGAT